MTSKNTAPAKSERPFPWRCIECRSKEVSPRATNYTMEAKHDGRAYTVNVPDLEIPTCGKCGMQIFTAATDDRIVAALRVQIGLLAPHEIQQHRSRLELNQHELAERLGIAKETVSRWETGAMIQSRAMDNLLRLYFASEEVRNLLMQRFQPMLSEPADPTAAAVAKVDRALQDAQSELESLKRQLAG